MNSTGLGEWAAGMRWSELIKMTYHKPATTEYEEGSVGRFNSLMLDVRELQEPVLYAAAMSPIPIEWVGQLTYQRQRRCLDKS